MTADDCQALLQVAKTAIVAHVSGLPVAVSEMSGALGRCAGAFVSVYHRHRLRGCIGHIHPDQALAAVVARAAVAACTADPRFPPVTADELEELEVEISVLGPLVAVSAVDDILVGRDGLVIERGRHRGLLLPQVAVEWQWSPETFLAQTCYKAGLPPEAWEHGATIWRFEAEVFRTPLNRDGAKTR
jgi:AmmeMemoRadiSam system protein A